MKYICNNSKKKKKKHKIYALEPGYLITNSDSDNNCINLSYLCSYLFICKTGKMSYFEVS